MKHGAWKKIRWEFYTGLKDPWWEQCVEYSSRSEKNLQIWCNVRLEWNHISGKQCSLVCPCVEERGWSCLEKGIRFSGWRSKEEREAKEDMVKAGWERKYEDWFEKERCTFPFKVECRHKQDCCWVEVNLATLTCWGYYQILNIGDSLSLISLNCQHAFCV